jgi:nucleoid-associated protein YgaU
MFSSLSLRRQHAPSGAIAVLLFSSAFLAFMPQVSAQSTDSQQSSQDPAEAARQERARKQQSSSSGEHHVYTNEDLRRGKILTPEDQSRAEAAKQKPAPPLNTNPTREQFDASGKPHEPLGDVARRYRNLHRDKIYPSPFHLPANQPEFAAPKFFAPLPELKPNYQPQPPARNFALMNPSTHTNPAPIVSAPSLPSAPIRRVDPFSRRRQPMPPVMAVRPNMPRASVQPNLPAPNFAPLGGPVGGPVAHANVSMAPRPTPVVASNTVVVQPGDTLWTLSRQHLGRGTRWLEFMAANPNLPDPTRLAPGTTLVLPSRMTTRQAKSMPHSVTVQAGDTLSQIALTTYGHASAWTCIAQANPALSNPHLLSVGQSLVLPQSCFVN